MEFLSNTKIDFMRHRLVFMILSVILVVVGIVAVFVHGRLNVGIDFTGGTQLVLQFQERPSLDELRDVLGGGELGDVQLQRFGEDEAQEVILRVPPIEGEEEGSSDRVTAILDQRYNPDLTGIDLNRQGSEALANLLVELDPDGYASDGQSAAIGHYEAVADGIIDQRQEDGLLDGWDEVSEAAGVSPEVLTALQANGSLGSYTVLSSENVGPQIGRELRQRGFWAVGLSMLGMMAYIWVRFELRFGLGALVAVFHDVLVVLGLYALADYEFNLTTIAAFLTLIGYSVNDTVIIFDRVRENMRSSRREGLADLINVSINQTLSRTVLTSGTTLFAVAALYVFGGDVLRGFAFILMVGILVGTYSSIYVASPFTLAWERYFGVEARARRARAGKGSKKKSKANA